MMYKSEACAAPSLINGFQMVGSEKATPCCPEFSGDAGADCLAVRCQIGEPSGMGKNRNENCESARSITYVNMAAEDATEPVTPVFFGAGLSDNRRLQRKGIYTI